MRALKVFCWSMVALVGLVTAVAAALLFTQPGRDALVGLVHAVTRTQGLAVELGRLTGNPLRDLRLESVRVEDADGPWLIVTGLRLQWQPLKLLAGMPGIQLLAAEQVQVLRLPAAGSSAETVPDTTPFILSDWIKYIPEEFDIKDIDVHESVAGRAYRLYAQVGTSGRSSAVAVGTLAGPATVLSGTLNLLDIGQPLRADLHFTEAPLGLVAGVMRLPSATALEARVVGELAGQRVSVTEAWVQAGSNRAEVSGGGLVDGSQLAAQFRLQAGRLSDFQNLAGRAFGGVLHAAGDVSGSLADIRVAVEVSESSVAVAGVAVRGLAMAGTFEGNVLDANLPFAAQARVVGTVVPEGGSRAFPLVALLDASGSRDDIAASSTLVMTGKNENARLQAAGRVQAHPATSATAAVDGFYTHGRDTFTVRGGLVADAARVNVPHLVVAGPGVDLSGSVAVQVAEQLAEGALKVRIPNLQRLAGMFGVQVQGAADADVALSHPNGVQAIRADVRRLQVAYGPYKARVLKPFALRSEGLAGTLSPLELELAGGRVLAQGRVDPAAVQGKIGFSSLDVGQLIAADGEAVLTGKVSGNVDLSGKPAAPVLVFKAGFAGASGEHPLTVHVDGDWRGRVLRAKAEAASRQATAAAQGQLGVGLSLLPFRLDYSEAAPVQGKLTAAMPLNMLNAYLWASRQHVEGQLDGQGTVAGTLGAPRLGGRFALRNASYRQTTSGVCLNNVSADLMGANDALRLVNLTANDGQGGTLAGSARLGLDSAQALTGQVVLSKLQLFCGGLASGQIDGTLKVAGSLMSNAVTGALVLGPLNVQLPGNQTSADVPFVDAVRAGEEVARERGVAAQTRLNVTLDAPRQIFVRGRGLDAEFGGKLSIGGTVETPRLTGSFDSIRGKFALLDRTLQLDETKLAFMGPMPPSPFLSMRAVTTVNSTLVTVTMSGPATSPKLVLGSDPMLPQDEILALVLFGRKMEGISPFEALRLAQATRELAGYGSGEPSILDKARGVLGIDTLDIGSDADSGVTVTTGKYLTNSIFLSIKQGAEPADRQVKTELELLPSVTGNTAVDGLGQQSFGLEWRRDY